MTGIRQRERHLTVLAVAALLASVAACSDSGGGSEDAAPPSTASTTSGAGSSVSASGTTGQTEPDASQSAATEPAGDGSYEEAPCPDPNVPCFPAVDLGPEYTCGFLTVPETRSDPGGRTVRLAVATVAAVSSTPAKDPIVYLDGGPGSTGLVSAPRAVAAGMNADRDVIFVDQRGTYHSDPFLSCPEQDAFYAEVVAMAYSDPATGERSDAATAACRDRLAAEGVALASYDTAENAADIADLRLAMGIDDWNVYGVSYGTLLALTVLRDHPDGIRSVVLDSVVPPNFSSIPAFWPAAAAAYEELFAACAGQAACAAAYPDLEAEFTDTVNRLDAAPLVVPVSNASGDTVEVTIDGYKFANAVLLLLAVGPAASKDLPRMIHEIAAGDGAAMAATILSSVPPSGFVGLGLQWGVVCREAVPQTSLDEVVTTGRQVLPDFPEGVLRLLPQVPRFFDDCAIWDVGIADAQAGEAVVSGVPVLIMGGTFDAVTAPSWQEAVTPGLNASQVVNFPGLGHQVFLQSACPVAVMRAFVAAPDEPVDKSCVAEMAVPRSPSRDRIAATCGRLTPASDRSVDHTAPRAERNAGRQRKGAPRDDGRLSSRRRPRRVGTTLLTAAMVGDRVQLVRIRLGNNGCTRHHNSRRR
ncbi:MAG: alpha/beta fold hydrolase [Ilumatobacteraceae bacterium]